MAFSLPARVLFAFSLVLFLVVGVGGCNTDAAGTGSGGAGSAPHPDATGAARPQGRGIFAPLSTDLSLAATAPATIVAGTTMSYVITVTNNGPDDATGVGVTMTMPAGVSFVGSSGAGWACAAAPDLSCTGPDTPNGTAAAALTVQLAVASSTTGTITGKPTAVSATADPSGGNNEVTLTTAVSQTADLNISASGPASVATSSPLSYAISVGNAGPSDAVNATMSVTLPAGAAYNGFAGAGWVCNAAGQVVTCKSNVTAGAAASPLTLLTTSPAAAGTVNPTFNLSAAATDPNSGDNASSVSTQVIAPLALSPASASVFPRATKAFAASGGVAGYTYSMQSAPSGGTIDGAGNYTAGTNGSVTDVVKVTDSVGTTSTSNVNVGAGATITPASKSLAPKAAQTFVGSGGNGSFTYGLVTNNSGATIGLATGVYTAGPTGSTTDVVQATDSLGNFAQATITVGAGIGITPAAPPVTPPKGSLTFTAVGGNGGGYVWSVMSATGATIGAGSGVYKAGAAGSTTDTVTVTDPLGNTASVVVTVGPGLQISPLAPSTSPRGSVAFGVTGGSGLGYAWAITTNNSGGTITPATGAYTAGTVGSKTDTIRVTDSLGNVATTTVTVGPGVAIVPAAQTTAPKSAIAFSATGGSGAGYTYGFIANGSGGSLTAGGAYTAGPTGSKTDTIRVTDSLGNTATATITVSAGVSIIPPSPSVAPKGTVAFVATGGSNSGFSWAITQNNSGGSIVPSTGAYSAGPTGTVTDTVAVTDSLGNTASVNVSVGGGLAINPVSPSTTPKGSVSFKVTGGSGMGYVWAMAGAPSGGIVVAATGAYTAGTTGNVTDTVQVTDSLGNVATMTVSVGAAVSVTPSAAALAPLGTASFNAAGGSGAGYVWTINPNKSGGTIGATGAYKAGAVGSVTDTVVVTDSLGNVATAQVTLSAAIAITPAMITLPPRGSQSFGVSGGAGGYSFVMQTNASGGNVSAAGGSYTAGSTGSVTDVVKVTDKNGATSQAQITVGPQIGIQPAVPEAPPLGPIAFVGTGGAGVPYTWKLLASNSGASINASTGAYLAGMTPNVTDTVQVLDALGNVAQVNVSVGSGLTVNPTKATVAPRGALAFFVRGGSGTGYVWSLEANASGASIDKGTGKYVAGATANVMDVVRVTDAVGAHESIPVTVGPGVSVTPPTTNVASGAHLGFNVAGGSGMAYAWSLADNQSGGKIDPSTGVYTAGAKANVVDIVSVQDSLHNGASATVHVLPAAPTGSDGGADGGALDAGLEAGLGEVVVPPPQSGCGCAVVGGEPRDSGRSGSSGAAATLASALATLGGLAIFVARRRKRI